MGACAAQDASACGGLFLDLVTLGAAEAAAADLSGCANQDLASCGWLWVDIVSLGLAGGAAVKTTCTSVKRVKSTKAAKRGRGMGDLGGVISPTGRNKAGGLIYTSSGPINQNDFAGIVNGGLMRGDDVHILTGAHGHPDGTMVPDRSMYADDVARFGDLPGVKIHNLPSMTPVAIRGVLQRSGTIIGGFCDSTACLEAFR